MLVACLDALDDGTDGVAEGAASARVLVHLRQVGFLIERYRLVSRVVARHVTFPAVDAHLRVDESDHMLLVVKVVVRPDPVQGRPDHLGKLVLIVLFNLQVVLIVLFN